MAHSHALIVSLEAIFLSTFVMIGQNRQGTFQPAKSDRDYRDVNASWSRTRISPVRLTR